MNEDPMTDGSPVDEMAAESRRIPDAVTYLKHCIELGSSFAVLTDNSEGHIEIALEHFFVDLRPGTRIARVPAPTDSGHAFLEAVLAQLGFEPFESTSDDLQRLLHVVLRQGATQQTDTIILIERAQDFGPRVFEAIRELARNSRDFAPPALIVMTGNADLNRVLDSKGMASVVQLTRLRFDFDSAPGRTVQANIDDAVADGPPVPEAKPGQGPALVLAKDEEVIRRVVVDRDRMLIGRSEYSDICIASRYVSRQHALLLRNADGEWLIDLNSTNGTSVNSKVVRQQRLEHGDIINIGNYRLHYENPGGRTGIASVGPSRDQLSETIVMRSLQALRATREEPAERPDSASTAA